MRAIGNVGEEAEPALVDADQRNVERRQAPRDREHRAVAAEDDRDVGVRSERLRRRGREVGEARRARRVGLDHHVVAARDEKRSETRQRLRDVGAHVAPDQRHPAETGGGRAAGRRSIPSPRLKHRRRPGHSRPMHDPDADDHRASAGVAGPALAVK